MTFTLSLDEGAFLVKLARKAITHFFKTSEIMTPPEDTPEKFYEKCGVFVTLNSIRKDSVELRGCIGYPYPSNTLVEATIDSAVNAAFDDPRFPPLTKKELDSIVIETSILTPLEQIITKDPKGYVKSITIGKDGLVVEKGWCKGLLLPQVPVEASWDEEDFLSHCCLKAGLPPDSWLLEGPKIYRFQAIIFEETFPNGPIKRLELNTKKPQ